MSISELRKAVEAGIATGGPADALVVPKEMGDLIASVIGDDDELWSDFVEAHDGSLDAAKRLHDALLPGWGWETGANATFASIAQVWKSGRDKAHVATSETPARAFLLAILRALEQEGDHANPR